MNRLANKVPVKENYTYEGRFPDIRPPQASMGRTDFGDCLIMAGTESFLPVTIQTLDSSNPTLVGSIINTLNVNPTLLLSTRLKKISENYEKWYPRKLVLEYVPQGSALDAGAIISIPVMDPSDTFTGSIGNDAIRRALAYERSYAFNIYDRPQIELPPAQLDEPYYVIPGSDARLEISHAWFLMAQTSFDPHTDETERVIGWFKLHYVIEFYEPRIPDVEDPLFNIVGETGSPVDLFFGTERAEGDRVIGSVDILFPDPPGNIFTMQLQTPLITYAGVFNQGPLLVSDGQREFRLLQGTILFIRVDHDVTPIFSIYSNVNDCFEQNNPLTFADDRSTATTYDLQASIVQLWN